MDYSDIFRNIPDYVGLFLEYAGGIGIFRNIPEYSGIFWNIYVSRIILDYFGLFRIISDYFGLFWIISDYFGIFRNILSVK